MRAAIELPSLDELPQTTCSKCERSLINGLFSPGELRQSKPLCYSCTGEVNIKFKRNRVSGVASL